MNWMNGRKILSIFLLFCLAIPLRAEAQSSELDQIKKNGFKVIKESKGRVIIDGKKLAVGQKIMFVHYVKELDEMETISEGVVKVSNDKLSLIELNTDKLQKFPQAGDYGVTLGEPIDWNIKTVEPGKEGFATPIEPAEILETGYFDLGYTSYQGSFSATSTNRANSFKRIPKYNLSGFHFLWHPDFFPNYGLGFTSESGNIPLYDYYGVLKPTNVAKTHLELSYRNKLGPSQIRWKLFLLMESVAFTTANDDEYVLSSKSTGMGLGGLLGYEFNPYLPMASTGAFGSPMGIYVETVITPNLTVLDTATVLRGSSSSANSLTYSLKYSHVFYIEFIPWFKRYFLDFKYTTTATKIQFSGETKNGSTNFYTVPQNGSYTESETLMSVSLGFRMDDWMGRSLKPRDK